MAFGVTKTTLLADGKEQEGYLTAHRKLLEYWPHQRQWSRNKRSTGLDAGSAKTQ